LFDLPIHQVVNLVAIDGFEEGIRSTQQQIFGASTTQEELKPVVTKVDEERVVVTFAITVTT
jgi:hypothetical protein